MPNTQIWYEFPFIRNARACLQKATGTQGRRLPGAGGRGTGVTGLIVGDKTAVEAERGDGGPPRGTGV